MAPPRRPPPDALVSGYLRKLGRRRWTWKRRFFMLSRTHASLTYWQDEAAYAAGAVPLGSILVTSSKAAIEEGPLTELLCRGSAGPTSDAERTLNTALRRMTYALNQRAREAGERGAGGAAQEGEAEEDSLARWLAADGASATFEERVEALGCGANRTLFMRVTGARLKRRTGAESYSTRSACRCLLLRVAAVSAHQRPSASPYAQPSCWRSTAGPSTASGETHSVAVSRSPARGRRRYEATPGRRSLAWTPARPPCSASWAQRACLAWTRPRLRGGRRAPLHSRRRSAYAACLRWPPRQATSGGGKRPSRGNGEAPSSRRCAAL